MKAGDLNVKPMQLAAAQSELYLDTGFGQTTSRPGRHPQLAGGAASNTEGSSAK